MNEERMLMMLSHVDDAYILEASPCGPGGKRRRRAWRAPERRKHRPAAEKFPAKGCSALAFCRGRPYNKDNLRNTEGVLSWKQKCLISLCV